MSKINADVTGQNGNHFRSSGKLRFLTDMKFESKNAKFENSRNNNKKKKIDRYPVRELKIQSIGFVVT